MRARLVGYSGARPPVPGTEPVVPIDPNPDPPPNPDDPSIPDPLTLVLEDGVAFHKVDYLALGYNRFDVLCIGGAGGSGGHLAETIPDSATHQQNPPYDYDLLFDSFIHRFGGGGGGGGIHRVKGRLALLPTVVPVVVGAAGADGGVTAVTAPFHDWRSGGQGALSPEPPIPPGEDGHASSFGGVICRASGGKGAVGVNGGAGGVGNAALGGGGAAPGTAGTWDGVIGSGGGGGQGGSLVAFPDTFLVGSVAGPGTAGGNGAVSTADPTTQGPGDFGPGFGFDFTRVLSTFPAGQNYLAAAHVDAAHAYGGHGGGAKPFVLNGESVQYGSKAGGRPGTGLVIIRLTYVIT